MWSCLDNSGELADRLLDEDPELQRLSRRMHRQQRRLRAALEPEQYRLYLLLEETANRRCLELVCRVRALESRVVAPRNCLQGEGDRCSCERSACCARDSLTRQARRLRK